MTMKRKTLFERTYSNQATGGGYIFRRELVGDSIFRSNDQIEMKSAYTLEGLALAADPVNQRLAPVGLLPRMAEGPDV